MKLIVEKQERREGKCLKTTTCWGSKNICRVFVMVKKYFNGKNCTVPHCDQAMRPSSGPLTPDPGYFVPSPLPILADLIYWKWLADYSSTPVTAHSLYSRYFLL